MMKRNLEKAEEDYIIRLYKLAHVAAKEYKEMRIAPFEVDEREKRLRKERYIKWSYTMWGAIEALGIAGKLDEERQEEYENIICMLDSIAYEDD